MAFPWPTPSQTTEEDIGRPGWVLVFAPANSGFQSEWTSETELVFFVTFVANLVTFVAGMLRS